MIAGIVTEPIPYQAFSVTIYIFSDFWYWYFHSFVITKLVIIVLKVKIIVFYIKNSRLKIVELQN